MKINCIIVDDEPASREVLEKYVEDTDSLHLIAVCKNAMEANELLIKQDIDLMFLDINMPKVSGIQLLKSLSLPPKVIFTTAYSEHAIDGFELNAVDYLLKPFSFERFLKAVNKYSQLINKGNLNSNRTVLLKSDKKLYRILIDDIVYLEAVGDYVKILFKEQSILVHGTFQNLLEQISHPNIIRIHRSYAISITKFDFIDGNQISVNNKIFPIGKAYRNELMSLL